MFINILFLKCGDPRDGSTDKGICHTSLQWPSWILRTCVKEELENSLHQIVL